MLLSKLDVNVEPKLMGGEAKPIKIADRESRKNMDSKRRM
jgi:hypothetical protein